jgi:hypothetical protein
MNATYNLNGGFKPAIKRFADLDGPDFRDEDQEGQSLIREVRTKLTEIER